jgi:RNA polymerase sigma factor for flagellar operon FliA
MQADLDTALGGLWSQYQHSHSADLRRQLVLHYLGLVRYVVARLGMQVHHRDRSLESGDVIQMGVLGLLSAIDRYNPVAGVKFETFAVPRIRGAIIDELREIDWVPRAMRARFRSVSEAERKLSQEAGRDVLDSEVARRLNMSVDDLRKIMAPLQMSPRTSGVARGEEPDSEPADEGPDPLEALTGEELRTLLRDAIKELPERERTVLALYYYEGLKMTEIGQVLEITESRVSQIHASAMLRLRNALRVAR